MQPHDQLQRIARKTGWTQAELAELTGINVRQIKRILHREATPSATTRQAIDQLWRSVQSRSFRLEARARNGAVIWLKRVYAKLEHGGRGLDAAQIDVYAAAIRAATPLIGNDLTKARDLLERAGFAVRFVDRQKSA
jgi:transcriptional regulator with XRE-family HTH domain